MSEAPRSDVLDHKDEALLQKLKEEGLADRFYGPTGAESVDSSLTGIALSRRRAKAHAARVSRHKELKQLVRDARKKRKRQEEAATAATAATVELTPAISFEEAWDDAGAHDTVSHRDDAGAHDTVSHHPSLASASTTTRPGTLTFASPTSIAPGDQTVMGPTTGVTALTTVPLVAATLTTPATGTGATDSMGDFDSWLSEDVAGVVWEEVGVGGRMLGGRGCARLACTCRAAWHMLQEHNWKAKDFWLATLEKEQQVRLLEERTAAETRELNPRGTILHGCPQAKVLPAGPYHAHDFDSVVVVVCPANARDDFRIGASLTLTLTPTPTPTLTLTLTLTLTPLTLTLTPTPTPTPTLTLTRSASPTLTLTLTLTRYPRARADVRRREHRSEEIQGDVLCRPEGGRPPWTPAPAPGLPRA